MAWLKGLSHMRRILQMKTGLSLGTVKVSAMSSESGDFSSFLQSIFTTPNLGTVTTEAKCKRFCVFYRTLSDISTKAAFLSYLAQYHGINQDTVIQGAQTLAVSQDRGEAFVLKVTERLRTSMTPGYQSLLQQIGRIEGGVKFLVDMRADILNCMTSSTSELDSAHFQALNRLLQELLTLWFAVGFLELQRVTWTSPCDIVQKISDYEAVHPIRSWTDLKNRVGSYRRCYVFTHHSMPREPIVVLHTALTNEISSSIHSIIHNPRFKAGSSDSPITEAPPPPTHEPLEEEDPAQITTAVFYSITSTQRGLKGVELGNYLIKRVVHELQSEFPHIAAFSSLSPVPGFRDWLISQINLQIHRANIGEEDSNQILLTQEEMEPLANFRQQHQSSTLEAFKHLVQSNQWLARQEAVMAMKAPLMRLGARYLYLEKRRGFALNPVANFHLANGAVLWRINFLADTSMRGLSQSCGLMVNYRYYLNEAENNSQEYLLRQQISVSQNVLDLITPNPANLVTVAAPVRTESVSSLSSRGSGTNDE